MPGIRTVGHVIHNLYENNLPDEALRFHNVSHLNGFSHDQPVSSMIRARNRLNIPEQYRTPIRQRTPIQQRGPSLGERPSGRPPRRESPTTH